MKRLILFITVIFSSLCLWADVWDGTSIKEPALSGSTYTISQSSELAWIAQKSITATFSGYTLVLTADLDFGSNTNWIPIGTQTSNFAGTFDGQNHVIRNLNISYSSVNSGIGLFGYTATSAVIKNIAISSGRIIADEKDNIGCFVGYNAGTISHCFNMAQIVLSGNNSGGLVGTNTGTITYCYNTGIIYSANNNVGGLVGVNSGSINNVYNIGYCANVAGADRGALIGLNSGSLSKVFYDQQMCLQEAGTGVTSGFLAVTETSKMFNIFSGDNEWKTTNNVYPELTCFAGKDVSLASVSPALLNTTIKPIERADGVTRNFAISEENEVVWVSPNIDIIEISNGVAHISHPCQSQIVILTATKGNDTKQVFTTAKGFEIFDAGSIYGEFTTCQGSNEAQFGNNHVVGQTMPSGGKDDDLSHYPYHYKLECYRINGNDTILYKSWSGNENWYKQFVCPTDEQGVFVYKRYARDQQCRDTFLMSDGIWTLTVYDPFLAGSIPTDTNYIYGTTNTFLINELTPASGGNANYHYHWMYDYSYTDPVTGSSSMKKDVPLVVNNKWVDTLAIVASFNAPGTYIFHREVADTKCSNNIFDRSDGEMTFIVYETLNAGEIISDTIDYCDLNITDTIIESKYAEGGNANYSYRWKLNGSVISDADTTLLDLSTLTFTAGQTYAVTREVKDDSGFTEWTASKGTVTLIVHKPLTPGTIVNNVDNPVYMCYDEQLSVKANSKTAAVSDGAMTYRWLLSSITTTSTTVDTTTIDTLAENNAAFNAEIPLSTYKLQYPATLLLNREVTSNSCEANWQASEGSFVFMVGKPESRDSIAYVCERDMPYNVVYTFADGRKDSWTFNANGESHPIEDTNIFGCSKTLNVICQTTTVPIVSVEGGGTICPTDSKLEIPYEIVSGAPTHYHIAFNDAAKACGLQDIDGELDGSGLISVSLPVNSAGEWELNISFLDKQSKVACDSEGYKVSITLNLAGYIHTKWNDVIFIDNNGENGQPDPDKDLTFSSFQWWKNGEPIEGANEPFYYDPGGLSGTYFVTLVGTDGREYRTCDFDASTLAVEDAILSDSPADIIRIYDLSGRLVDEYYHSTFDANRIALHSGIYIVKRITDNICLTNKIVVL